MRTRRHPHDYQRREKRPSADILAKEQAARDAAWMQIRANEARREIARLVGLYSQERITWDELAQGVGAKAHAAILLAGERHAAIVEAA